MGIEAHFFEKQNIFYLSSEGHLSSVEVARSVEKYGRHSVFEADTDVLIDMAGSTSFDDGIFDALEQAESFMKGGREEGVGYYVAAVAGKPEHRTFFEALRNHIHEEGQLEIFDDLRDAINWLSKKRDRPFLEEIASERLW